MTTLSETLLANGLATQDPQDTSIIIYNVPFPLKKDAVDAGAFEVFAGEYGWSPTVLDDEGNEVPNELDVYTKCHHIFWEFAKAVLRGGFIKKAEAQAREQAQAAVDALL